MNDAVAIVWKEWREVMGQRGLRGKTGILLNVAVFGVVIPLQFGAPWVTSPVSALAWSWVPMFLVMTVIADAFAGERERHTLETLLASRLSDRAILFGKIGAAFAYAGAITLSSLLLGLATVNLAHGRGALILYSGSSMLGMLVFGFLGALLVASVGVLISLRAATVRLAEQTLGGLIILAMVVPFVAIRVVPPEWKTRLISPENSALVAMVLAALLAAIDAGLVFLALKRFRRSRLIADGVLD